MRCDFDVSWLVTPFPSNLNNPPIIRHRSSTLVIYSNSSMYIFCRVGYCFTQYTRVSR
ncbi:unnamed protein product [Schistosoma curassoni]|uniref:Uncharacterized protein n=1 Tax=Schistosoma curassoni TaxID=6186 RepID=A0A183K3Z1_9TREM|nr:unnamed protein product [Schistosoma curassoni]